MGAWLNFHQIFPLSKQIVLISHVMLDVCFFFFLWWMMVIITSNRIIVLFVVTDVHGRTFGIWTLLTCTLCFLCAFNLENKPLYLATFLSFIYAFGHFLTEYLIYHTMAASNLTTVGIFAGTLLSSFCLILVSILFADLYTFFGNHIFPFYFPHNYKALVIMLKGKPIYIPTCMF